MSSKHESNNNWLSVLPTNTQFGAKDNMGIQMPTGISFMPLDANGSVQYIELNDSVDLFAAYSRCAPLAGVLSQMARAFTAGRIEVINRNTGNYVRGQYKEWERLLAKPNPIQTGKHFLKQIYTNVKVNGWCFALKLYPFGFRDRPYQIWALPPESIVWERKYYGMTMPGSYKNLGDVYRFYFYFDGMRTELSFDDLIMFSDSTITDPITLFPQSRLIPMRYPVSNSIAIYEASATLVQKRGALGILSNQSKDTVGHIPIEKEERERVESQFYSNYGLTRGQSQVIITTAALNWQQMAMNVKDLMLNEMQLGNMKDICEGLGYPFVLSAHSDQSTFTNSKSGDTRLFQNTIIPDSEDLIEQQLNEGLNTAEFNIEILINYEHLPAMQAAKKEESEALKIKNEGLKIEYDNNLITLNQWLIAIGRDKVVRPEFDKYKYELKDNQNANDNTPQN